MIKKAVEDNYGIVVEGIVKISEKAYKIFANNQIYLLKDIKMNISKMFLCG